MQDVKKKYEPPRIVETPFRRRLPLLAVLGSALVPSGACATPHPKDAGAPAGGIVSMQKVRDERQHAAALVKRLTDKDNRAAVLAGFRLVRMGARAVPELVKVVGDSTNKELSRRALAVLCRMEWKAVPSHMRKEAVKKVYPELLTFGKDGREPESRMAEAILLGIGAEAMPAYAMLLKAPFPLARMVALDGLLSVEWQRFPWDAVKVVRTALEGMKNDPVEAFREASREILKNIRKVYTECRGPDKGMDAGPGAGHAEQETGDWEQGTGGAYGQKKAA